jgi:hypothetical protein
MTSRRPAVGGARSAAIVVDASITAAWCFDDGLVDPTFVQCYSYR